MENKRLVLAYVPLTIFWLIDYYTKDWFASNMQSFHFGPLSFAYHENHGIIMGNLASLPLMLKTVFLTTLGFSLVASLPIIMALVKFGKMRTLLGLSLVLSGIIGNVTDRIIYGYVVDFIYLKSSYFTTPVFNVADAIQWVGYIMLFSGLYYELSTHYPDYDKRRNGWVNFSYQIKFALTFMVMYQAMAMVLIASGFTFLKFTLAELNVTQKDASDYLEFYTITLLVVLGVSSLAIMLIGKIISHRIAGPVYAIRRYLFHTQAGKRYDFKLRDQDHLKDLEYPLSEMNKEMDRLREFLRETEKDVPELPEETKKAA